MNTLKDSLYQALKDTPAGTAFDELLTVGDLVSVAELDECAGNIAANPNTDDAAEFIRDLGLQDTVFASACERVADVLEDA